MLRSAGLKPAPKELPPRSSQRANPARKLNVIVGERIAVQSASQLRAVRINGALPLARLHSSLPIPERETLRMDFGYSGKKRYSGR